MKWIKNLFILVVLSLLAEVHSDHHLEQEGIAGGGEDLDPFYLFFDSEYRLLRDKRSIGPTERFEDEEWADLSPGGNDASPWDDPFSSGFPNRPENPLNRIPRREKTGRRSGKGKGKGRKGGQVNKRGKEKGNRTEQEKDLEKEDKQNSMEVNDNEQNQGIFKKDNNVQGQEDRKDREGQGQEDRKDTEGQGQEEDEIVQSESQQSVKIIINGDKKNKGKGKGKTKDSEQNRRDENYLISNVQDEQDTNLPTIEQSKSNEIKKNKEE